jgi:hypothetical protein
MSPTLEDILQARRDAIGPDGMGVDVSGETLKTAIAEADKLHISEDVLIIALLKTYGTQPLDPPAQATAQEPAADTIGLPNNSARIVQREATKRKAHPAALVSAVLEKWRSQPDEIKQALADEIAKHKDATENKVTASGGQANL